MGAARLPVSVVSAALTVLSLCGAAVAAAVTLLWDGAFPPLDPSDASNAVRAEARGWSAITLGVAVPCGVAALLTAIGGSVRAQLWWLGTLAYLVYTFLELAVSPPFTPLYLVYVGTFATAATALGLGVARVQPARVARSLAVPWPRLYGGLAVAVGVLLGAAWLRDILARSLDGGFGWLQGPAAVRQVVEALDLGLQVPLALTAGLLSLRRREAAASVMGVFLVMATLMSAALTAMVAVRSALEGSDAWATTPFGMFAALTLIATAVYFRPDRLHRRANPAPRARASSAAG